MKTFLRIRRKYKASPSKFGYSTTKHEQRKDCYIELEWAIYKAELNK